MKLKPGDIFRDAYTRSRDAKQYEVLEIDCEKPFIKVRCTDNEKNVHIEEWNEEPEEIETAIERGDYKMIWTA